MPLMSPSLPAVSESYVELLKAALLHDLYPDFSVLAKTTWWRKLIHAVVNRAGLELVKPTKAADREAGWDWPRLAQTMIGRKRMENIQSCATQALADGVPGDFIETGVWRGGATIFMRGLLHAHGDASRRVWVADSFEGLPSSTSEVDRRIVPGYAETSKDELAVSLEDVRANFAKYNLLDDRVVFLKGWFKDTLPTAPIDKLALARLDGDLYSSTMDAITVLYPKLSVGGFLIIDDYGGWETCRIAVNEYRQKHGITEPIQKVDWTGAYWRKER